MLSVVQPSARFGFYSEIKEKSKGNPTSIINMGDFTVYISLDYKKEEITGRGISTVHDPKVAFDTLKRTIGEYQETLGKLNNDVPENKKRFWKGLRRYCQMRSMTEYSNWTTLVWAGYPLYQLPMNNVQDKAFLLRMRTSVQNGSPKECTVTHKQLHDMVNKQFRKFALNGSSTHESSYITDEPYETNEAPLSPQTAAPYTVSHPFNAPGIMQNPQSYSQLSAAQMYNVNKSTNQIPNSFCVNGYQPHGTIGNSVLNGQAITSSMLNMVAGKVEVRAQLQNSAMPQRRGSFGNVSQYIINRGTSMAPAANQPTFTPVISSDTGTVQKTKDAHPEKKVKTQTLQEEKANISAPGAELKKILVSFNEKLNENFKKLSKYDITCLSKELLIANENLGVNTIPNSERRYKRSRKEMEAANNKYLSLSEDDECDILGMEKQTADRKKTDIEDLILQTRQYSHNVRWTAPEECFLVGLSMECYLLKGSHDWDMIAKCYEIAWSAYSKKNGLCEQGPRSRSSLIRHYKSLKQKISNGTDKRSLLSFYEPWKEKYNMENSLINFKDIAG